jgi:hypothetical protein
MSQVAPDAVRAAALASLGAHADPRVAQIVSEAVLSIDHDVSQWEASTGRIVAHRVRVGVTASLLGVVRGHPHVEDEVTRLVSVAMAKSHGDRVSEVVFHHDPAAAASRVVETPYRGSLAPPEAPAPSEPHVSPAANLAEHAGDYLDAFGEKDVAAMARRADIAVTTRERPNKKAEHAVRVTLANEDASPSQEHAELLGRCLRDLLEGASSARVRCVVTPPPR